MDKPEERISIRINGKEKILLSEQELNEEVAAAKEAEIEDFDLEEENHADEEILDNVIDFEERRTGKRKKRVRSQVKKPILSKKKKNCFPRFRQKKQPTSYFKKLMIALIAAVIIGTGFGYILLSLFTDITSENEIDKTITNGQAVSQYAVAAEESETEQATDILVPTVINSMSVEVIQGGAFSSEESASQYALKIKEGGAAAVIVPESNPVLMFIGIGTSSSELEEISAYYQEKGQEIYIKRISTSAVETSRLNNQEAAFVSKGQSLFQSFISVSTEAFDSKSISEESWKDIETNFSQWTGLKPSQLPDSLESFSEKLSTAYQALAIYRSTNDEEELWKTQQVLLEGWILYNKWISKQ